MYEIDLSTIMLIGINDVSTKVVTTDEEFVVNMSSKAIIERSCKFFGSTLSDRIKTTNNLVGIYSKTPVIIEESRNIIFFPLKSCREKCNIWISYNNLDNYFKEDNKTVLEFKKCKRVTLNFSYYIIDNQITRSLILDYEIIKRRKSLEK